MCFRKREPSPCPLVCAFDDTGNIGHDERPILVQRHHAQVRLQRCERIVGDLRAGRAQPRNQRRLSRIRKSHQADVGQKLQLQPIVYDLTRFSRRCKTGRSPGRGGEVLIPASAAPAGRGPEALSGLRKIVDLFSGFQIVDHRSDRYLDGQAFAVASVAIRAFSVAALPGLEAVLVAKVQQRVHVRIAFEVDVAAPAAVAPARSPARDELFPPEGDAAVAAPACFQVNFYFVNKHGSEHESTRKIPVPPITCFTPPFSPPRYVSSGWDIFPDPSPTRGERRGKTLWAKANPRPPEKRVSAK